MDSTLEAGKRSGGSEQKSGKDGSSETREEQQKEEEGGSEAVPVDLKQTEDNRYDSDEIEESPPHEKPWYHTPDDDYPDSIWIGTFNRESDDSDVDYDSDSIEGARQRIRHMLRGNGLSYAFRVDDAPAFMYLARKLSCDEKSKFIFTALDEDKFSVAKALMEDETTDMSINARNGSNLLHLACCKGDEPLAHLVVGFAQLRGVLKRMIVAHDFFGRTPLSIAESSGMSSLCERLKFLSEDKAAGSSTTNADANLPEDNVAGSSTKNTQAKLSDDNTAGSPTKNAEANLSEDTTAGSSTKNAEANPSKKQKTQV